MSKSILSLPHKDEPMARCKNCSAPIEGYQVVCTYCGSRNDIDLTGIHEFTTRQPDAQRLCPRCNLPLTTIDLQIEGPFYIERCETCMGLFFDPGELPFLLEKTVTHVFTIDYLRLKDLSKEVRRRESMVQYIKCPVCQQLMNRVNFGARSGVIADQCREHGVWLDGGELKQLMDWRKAGGQILQEKRHVEQQAAKQRHEERRRREHNAFIAQAHGQSGGADDVFFSNREATRDLADLFFRFFR
jgi:Zn-finger nucleic acid-binding protein